MVGGVGGGSGGDGGVFVNSVRDVCVTCSRFCAGYSLGSRSLVLLRRQRSVRK